MYWYLLIICIFALMMFYLARPIIKQLIAESNGDLPRQDNNQVNYHKDNVPDENKKTNNNEVVDLTTYTERKKLFDLIRKQQTYMVYESFQANKIESRNGVSYGNKIAAGCKLKVLLKDDRALNLLMEVSDSKPMDELGYQSTFWLSPEEFQKYFRI